MKVYRNTISITDDKFEIWFKIESIRLSCIKYILKLLSNLYVSVPQCFMRYLISLCFVYLLYNVLAILYHAKNEWTLPYNKWTLVILFSAKVKLYRTISFVFYPQPWTASFLVPHVKLIYHTYHTYSRRPFNWNQLKKLSNKQRPGKKQFVTNRSSKHLMLYCLAYQIIEDIRTTLFTTTPITATKTVSTLQQFPWYNGNTSLTFTFLGEDMYQLWPPSHSGSAKRIC